MMFDSLTSSLCHILDLTKLEEKPPLDCFLSPLSHSNQVVQLSLRGVHRSVHEVQLIIALISLKKCTTVGENSLTNRNSSLKKLLWSYFFCQMLAL